MPMAASTSIMRKLKPTMLDRSVVPLSPTTDSAWFRMQLIRNHAESVVGDKGTTDLSNMVGFNFRMTEVEAAIGIEQLKKLPALSAQRTGVGARLTRGLAGLRGLRTPVVKPECSHVYYVLPLLFDEARCDAPRGRVVEALRAEGVP